MPNPSPKEKAWQEFKRSQKAIVASDREIFDAGYGAGVIDEQKKRPKETPTSENENSFEGKV